MIKKIPENSLFLSPPPLSSPSEGVVVEGEKRDVKNKDKFGKFILIGHRGSGMNVLQSNDGRMKFIKENSLHSFNYAAQFHLDFVEFDVQVTKDDCPVIFHDIHILTKDKGTIVERRVTEISLQEFLSYGPQREPGKAGKPMLRKTKDGHICEWKVENDEPLCTLEEVFEKVDKSLGFNIEMKFDDNKTYTEAELKHILQVVLRRVVNEHAEEAGRRIMFSSFLPDAVQLIRKLQDSFPVFFLTNGGCEVYADPRRNSLEEAIKVCIEGGLQGIVSQVKAIFRNPRMVANIKGSKLSLITYGHFNNVPEAVYMQHLMGIEGVIVDFVKEIKEEAVADFIKAEGTQDSTCCVGSKARQLNEKLTVQLIDDELSSLMKLIPQLIHTPDQ